MLAVSSEMLATHNMKRLCVGFPYTAHILL